MPKTKIYEPKFKKKIVCLYLEGHTIKSLNEEYQLGKRTVCNGCGGYMAPFEKRTQA